MKTANQLISAARDAVCKTVLTPDQVFILRLNQTSYVLVRKAPAIETSIAGELIPITEKMLEAEVRQLVRCKQDFQGLDGAFTWRDETTN